MRNSELSLDRKQRLYVEGVAAGKRWRRDEGCR
jgi:hypothetical protein